MIVARVARAGLAAFAAVLALQHVLVRGLDPAHNRVSEYANGPLGAVMTAGFGAWAASLLATAALARASRPLAGSLALAGSAAVLVAVFPTVTVAGELPPGQIMTAGGRTHDLAALVLQLALSAGLVASLFTVGVPRWFRPLAGLLGTLALVLLTIAGAPGYVQRCLLLIALAWQAGLLRALTWSDSPTASGPVHDE